MKRFLETDELWTAVDSYLETRLVPVDEALEAALAASTKAGLPEIQVSPNQGKLLMLLARDRCEAHSGDRYAWRLQHDLAGARPCP